ncbi:MAG: S-ribosylhomocysteine lyase, partial [Sulfurovum sp.]
AWKASMEDVLGVKSEGDIPELNIYQCGTCKMHSLNEAQQIAQKVLDEGIGTMSNKKLKMSKKQLQKAAAC